MSDAPLTADGEPIVEGMVAWAYLSASEQVVHGKVERVYKGWSVFHPEWQIYTTWSTQPVHPRHLYASREKADAAMDAGK